MIGEGETVEKAAGLAWAVGGGRESASGLDLYAPLFLSFAHGKGVRGGSIDGRRVELEGEQSGERKKAPEFQKSQLCFYAIDQSKGEGLAP